MNRLLFVLTLMFLSFSLFAQTDQSTNGLDIFYALKEKKAHSGTVQVVQDERLKTQLNEHIQWNRKMNGMIGFRIRIYSDSGQPARAKANSERARFESSFPEVNSYIDFDSPNWKLYVGDFRTKSEALSFLQKIKSNFPKAFIVSQKINYPKL